MPRRAGGRLSLRDNGSVRVAHVVCSDRFAGVERYLTYVAPVLVERRHEVTVIGGEPERMTRALDGSGVQWRPARTAADAVRALLRQRGAVDLVHVHMTDAELVGVSTRPIHRAPVVATLHFAQHRGSSPARTATADLVARGLSAQVAISQFVAHQAGVPDAVVVPNGVPWSEPEAEREKVVLVAQRLESEKDGSLALRAWAISGLADRGWRLVFAGEGSQRSEMEREVGDLGVRSSVTFVGGVSDLASRMARASIFLATAPAEPFGLSVVEAMAAGLPVVAAAGGAHLETVGVVDEARLFPSGDVTAAASMVVSLAKSSSARGTYGEQLRDTYLRRFTIDRHVDGLLQTYSRAAG